MMYQWSSRYQYQAPSRATTVHSTGVGEWGAKLEKEHYNTFQQSFFLASMMPLYTAVGNTKNGVSKDIHTSSQIVLFIHDASDM